MSTFSDRVGAGAEPGIDALGQSLKDIAYILAEGHKFKEAEHAAAKGTLASISKHDELAVLTARMLNKVPVNLWPGEVGKGLAKARRTVTMTAYSTGFLRQMQLCCLPLNRHIYGIAALNWWGKAGADVPSFHLTAGDFPTCRAETFDKRQVGANFKLKTKPKPVVGFLVWQQQVHNVIHYWCQAYGEQYRDPIKQFVAGLTSLYQSDDKHYNFVFIRDAFEEMLWNYCVEIKQTASLLLKRIGKEVVTKDDFISAALTPRRQVGLCYNCPIHELPENVTATGIS